jgi:predicted dienelactone hydrolase
VSAPNISDAGEQVRDVRFLIDQLLADPTWGPAIDGARIGVMGHSLGGITSWFLSFGERTRDPRIRAAVMLGAGDPVVASQATDVGLSEAGHSPSDVPALLVSAEKDLFTRMMGPPGTAYPRLGKPKYEVMITGGAHVWFKDGDVWPSDNKNPDCFFFELHSPGFQVPGGEERVPLIGPARQQEITLAASRAFLDAYLKQDPAAHARLHALAEEFAEITLACDV